MSQEQSKEDLERNLEEHLSFLEDFAQKYDDGNFVYAKPMAVSLRVLLHNTKTSHALLHQLGLQNEGIFDSTLDEFPEELEDTMRVGSYAGLFGVSLSDKGTFYTPYLDEVPGGQFRKASYNDYWDREVFVDKDKSVFTRKQIVLAVANQDGGAHIDPKLSDKYVNLVKKNSLGWKTFVNNVPHDPPNSASYAAVRQIAHEILKSFRVSYSEKKIVRPPGKSAVMVGGMGFALSMGKSKLTQTQKVGRNEKCPCGSDLKYKKCCGK